MQSTESRCSADHFLPRPKNGEGTAALRRCIPDPAGYQSAGWQRARAAPGGQGKHTLYSCYSADCQRHRSGHRRRTGEGR